MGWTEISPKYRTTGGGTVTVYEDKQPGTDTYYWYWCSGCRRADGDHYPSAANDHAGECRAIPGG